MSDNYEILPVAAETEAVNPPAKWLWYLFYIHIASMLLSLPALIFLDNPITPWLGHLATAGVIVCLFHLALANGRYRTAAVLTAVQIVLTVLSRWKLSSLLTIAASVLSIIAAYQEFHGHSEAVAPKDPKLAKKWCSLFTWQLVIGVIAGFSSVAAVVIMVLAEMNQDTIISLTAGAVILVGMIPGILYLLYMRRMIRMFET